MQAGIMPFTFNSSVPQRSFPVPQKPGNPMQTIDSVELKCQFDAGLRVETGKLKKKCRVGQAPAVGYGGPDAAITWKRRGRLPHPVSV
jgi:hypothetical protein